VPLRSKLESYAVVEVDIDRRVAVFDTLDAGEDVTGDPIRYRKSVLRIRRLVALYRLVDCCIVRSFHNEMNLVAQGVRWRFREAVGHAAGRA
jgi:trehalose-6-phosphate synthase